MLRRSCAEAAGQAFTKYPVELLFGSCAEAAEKLRRSCGEAAQKLRTSCRCQQSQFPPRKLFCLTWTLKFLPRKLFVLPRKLLFLTRKNILPHMEKSQTSFSTTISDTESSTHYSATIKIWTGRDANNNLQMFDWMTSIIWRIWFINVDLFRKIIFFSEVNEN